MATTIFQNVIYEMINMKEEVHAKLNSLVDSSNRDMIFSKNPDGSIACAINYKDYKVSLCITEGEVFQCAWQTEKNPSEAVKAVIEEKLFEELIKTDN